MTSVSLVAVSPKPRRQQLLAQGRGVDQVAVVGEGQRAVHRLDKKRLDVAFGVGASGAVTSVSNAVIPRQGVHRRRRENVGDEAGVLVQPHSAAVADRDAGSLLAAMLKGEQPEENSLSHALAVGCGDTEHAALLVRGVVDVQGER